MISPDPAVLVVGAGPAGLAAARAVSEAGDYRVLVVDRDDEPGGLPRFCHHPGFGWEYSWRLESGPRFARRLLGDLDRARVTIAARTTVLAVAPGPAVELIGPEIGRSTFRPAAVILATGIRERPRAARLVPGQRPERGVLTTGQLQQMVARGVPVGGRRAVVVGSEHVSFSVLLTARRAGLDIVAMVEPSDRVMSYALAAVAVQHLARTPIHLHTRIIDIRGSRRVEAVVLDGPGGRSIVACDTVIFTGDFVPDAPLAREGGIAIDPRTGGPAVDQYARTGMEGVFAAGNLLRAVESSGIAAIEGRRAGAAAAEFLAGRLGWGERAAALSVSEGIAYLVPQRWAARDAANGAPPLPPSLRVANDCARARVVLSCDGVAAWRGRVRPLLRQRRIALDLSCLNRLSAPPRTIEIMLDRATR